MPRSARWWRWRASWQCCCIACGCAEKCTNRCATARQRVVRNRQPKKCCKGFGNPSPSSGDCKVAAERAQLATAAFSSIPRWQPRLLEEGLQLAPEQKLQKRVRMEAGRVGEGRKNLS